MISKNHCIGNPELIHKPDKNLRLPFVVQRSCFGEKGKYRISGNGNEIRLRFLYDGTYRFQCKLIPFLGKQPEAKVQIRKLKDPEIPVR